MTFVAATNGQGNTLSLSISVPAGTGTTYVLVVRTYDGATSITWPAGFTAVSTTGTDGGGQPSRLRAATRVKTGSEGATFTGTINGTTSSWEARCALLNVSTLITSALAGAQDGNIAAGVSSPLTGASVTTGATGRYVFWYGHGFAQAGPGTVTAANVPTGFTRCGTRYEPYASNMYSMDFADKTEALNTTTSYSGSWTGNTIDTRSNFTATFVFQSATIAQERYRFYADDGSESASTALAAQDTTISLAVDVNARLRMLVNVSTGNPPAGNYTLQYRKVGTSAWVSLHATADAGVIGMFASGEQGGIWDAGDLSTMFQDTAGTTPVTTVGQAVARWNDKSGRGHHFVQSTLGLRPILQQENGKYYLNMISQWMITTDTINFSTTDKVMLWTGVKKNSDATVAAIAELGVSAEATTFSLFGPGNAANPNYLTINSGSIIGYRTATTYTAPCTNVISVQYDISGTTKADIRIDGVIPTLGADGDPGTGNFSNKTLFLGTRDSGNMLFNGRMYGLIVRAGTATASQRGVGESFMALRSGVTLI